MNFFNTGTTEKRSRTPASFDIYLHLSKSPVHVPTHNQMTMTSPIYLRNSLRFSRHALPLSIISRVPSTSISSHLSYSTNSTHPRDESNRSERIPTNDPSPRPPVPNVSETNAVPTSTGGKQDALLQEDPDVAEQRRIMQAPNRHNVWSRSQERREVAMRGPRFEQTIMELQVCRTFYLPYICLSF